MKVFGWLAAAALVALLVSGCGGGAQAESGGETGHAKPSKESGGETKAKRTSPAPPSVSVSVEGWENPTDLGIIVANQRGLFEDKRIASWVGVPYLPSRPIKYVCEGTDTFAVAPLPQVVMAREKGAPIISVGSLTSRPTTAMIWLAGSGIESLADLKGKTIAIPGLPFQKEFLAELLKHEGLTLADVHVKSVGYKLVPALLKGQAAAIFGGSSILEGVKLEELGKRPVITQMKSLGAPSYQELVVVTRKDLLAKNPGLVRRFMAAVRHGTDTALRDPGLAVKMIEEADEADPKNTPKLIKAEVKATAPILSRTGRIDPHEVSDLVHWMHEQGMVRRELAASKLFVNP